MSKLLRRAVRRIAKASAKHAVHGTVTKTRRAPLRSGGLLAAGAILGAVISQAGSRARPPLGSSQTPASSP